MIKRFRCWKRACLLVLLIVLLLCVALCMAAIFIAGRASAQGIEQSPLDVLLLIDHSNSMWDKRGIGSDPDLLRVQAANLFIAYLGVDAARPANRLGVVHFGGESILAVPLTPLDSPERRQGIRAAIADPQRLGWTDPLAALQLAYETLFPQGQRAPARQPVVILLSDGKPELFPAPSPAERAAYLADLRALVERFREHGCPIFTVALSNEATDADPEIQTIYRNLWQEIAAHTPPAEYHEARTAADLLPIYHAVVARLSGVEADTPVVETVVEGQAQETITVEAGLARMTLVILRSDPALEVRLVRPEGVPARPGDPDVQHTGTAGATHEEVWAIRDPRPGRWTLEFQGDSTVVVWLDRVSQARTSVPAYVIEVATAPAYVPAGHPLNVEVSVRETTMGEVVTGPDLQVVAELRRAGFAEASILARDDGLGCDGAAGDGRHCLTLPDPPPGACTLRLRAFLDGAEIARRESAFEVVLPPAADAPPEVMPLAVPVTAERPTLSDAHPGLGRVLLLALPLGLAVAGGVGGLLVRRRRSRVTLDGSLRVLAAPAVPYPHPGPLPGRERGVDPRPGPLPGRERSPLPTREGQGEGEVPECTTAHSHPGPSTGSGQAPLPGREREHPLEGSVLDLPAVPSAVLGGTGKAAVPLPGECPRVVLRAARAPDGERETWVAPLAGEEASAVAFNECPLATARRLCDGDVLTLGAYRLRYENLRQAGARRARRRPQRTTDWLGGVG